MSHIVQIKTQVRDPVAIASACHRLKLPMPRTGTAQLYRATATGVIVEFPTWRYPVVFATDRGEALYDNFGGRWGDQVHLDSFLQIYAAEKCKLEARRHGHTVIEQPLADGSLKLTVSIGGIS